MKTKTKALTLLAAAGMLVSASVLGTVAYLTSEDEVTNTFTSGTVKITLDEAKVNPMGQPIDDNNGVLDDITLASRVKENSYKLIPGHTYSKDPTVHFADGSEASWLFVKVENGIGEIEGQANQDNIEDQISDNGWTALTDADGVYYRQADANESGDNIDYEVFHQFIIDGTVSGDVLSDYESAEIKITAYAIQADGFDEAEAAWEAINE